MFFGTVTFGTPVIIMGKVATTTQNILLFDSELDGTVGELSKEYFSRFKTMFYSCQVPLT